MKINLFLLTLLINLTSCNSGVTSLNVNNDDEVNENELKFGPLEFEKTTENEIIKLYGKKYKIKEVWDQINSFDFPELKYWQKTISYEEQGITFVLDTDAISNVKGAYKLSAIVFNENYKKSIKGIQMGRSTFKDLKFKGMHISAENYYNLHKDKREAKIFKYLLNQSIIKFYTKAIDFDKAYGIRKEKGKYINKMIIKTIVFSRRQFRSIIFEKQQCFNYFLAKFNGSVSNEELSNQLKLFNSTKDMKYIIGLKNELELMYENKDEALFIAVAKSEHKFENFSNKTLAYLYNQTIKIIESENK